jgi:hypothetical protein
LNSPYFDRKVAAAGAVARAAALGQTVPAMFDQTALWQKSILPPNFTLIH